MRWQATSPSLEADLTTSALFPKPCRLEGAYLECGQTGLVGSLEFPWLEGTLSRVLVNIEWQNGQRLQRMLTPSSPTLGVYGIPSGSVRFLTPILVDYTLLGVEHILLGFVIICCVVASCSWCPNRRRLVATITAFTVARPTLAATVLDLVAFDRAVEAVIALSIVLVCAECLRRKLRSRGVRPGRCRSGSGCCRPRFRFRAARAGRPEAHPRGAPLLQPGRGARSAGGGRGAARAVSPGHAISSRAPLAAAERTSTRGRASGGVLVARTGGENAERLSASAVVLRRRASRSRRRARSRSSRCRARRSRFRLV